MGLAGSGWSEEHDVGAFGDEVEGAEVRDEVTFEGALEAVVEVLECLAGGEAGGANAALAAVVLSGGDFAFEHAARNSLWVQPSLRARSARRSIAAASDGAFNAWQRYARSLAGRVVLVVAITHPEHAVVAGEVADLDLSVVVNADRVRDDPELVAFDGMDRVGDGAVFGERAVVAGDDLAAERDGHLVEIDADLHEPADHAWRH